MSKEESAAMADFLAAKNKSLEERARLWAVVANLVRSRPASVVKKMEVERGLDVNLETCARLNQS